MLRVARFALLFLLLSACSDYAPPSAPIPQGRFTFQNIAQLYSGGGYCWHIVDTKTGAEFLSVKEFLLDIPSQHR